VIDPQIIEIEVECHLVSLILLSFLGHNFHLNATPLNIHFKKNLFNGVKQGPIWTRIVEHLEISHFQK